MKLRRGFLLGIVMAAVWAGSVLATHTSSGLTTLSAHRGSMDRADLATLVRELGASHAMSGSDLFVVRASLAAGGTTDWHGHTGPSIVIVTSGAIEVTTATPGGGCSVETYDAGKAFYHSEKAHTFVNRTAASAEFLVAYFVPAGSPVTHLPAPAC